MPQAWFCLLEFHFKLQQLFSVWACQVTQWWRIYLPMQGDTGDAGSVPGSGRYSGGGKSPHFLPVFSFPFWPHTTPVPFLELLSLHPYPLFSLFLLPCKFLTDSVSHILLLPWSNTRLKECIVYLWLNNWSLFPSWA